VIGTDGEMPSISKDASEHLAVLDAASDALAASTGCEARSAGPSTGSGREVSRR
jgi:hypothetical protein